MSGLFNDDTLSLYLKLKEAMKQYVRDAMPGGALNREIKPQDTLDAAALSLSPVPLVGDAAGLLADGYRYATDPSSRTPLNYGLSALGALPFVPAMGAVTAWHGSPHKFDKFDLSKIGTGEGAQAYGHGLYFAEQPEVAQTYKQSADWRQKTMDQMRYLVDGKEVMPKGVDDGLLYHYRMSAPDLFAERIQHLEKQKAGSIDQAKYYAEQSKLGDDPERYARMAKKSQEYANKFDEELQLAAKLQNQKVEAATGHLYKTDIPDEAVARFLDWDKPLSEQAKEVQAALAKTKNKQLRAMVDYANVPHSEAIGGEAKTMGEAFRLLNLNLHGKSSADSVKASALLAKQGIPGIRYLDGGSRGAGTGTSNFVVFDPDMIRILERNGEATGAKPWQPGEWEGLFKK